MDPGLCRGDVAWQSLLKDPERSALIARASRSNAVVVGTVAMVIASDVPVARSSSVTPFQLRHAPNIDAQSATRAATSPWANPLAH